MMTDAEKTLETYLAEIEKELPPVIFRSWKRWKDVLPMSPRSVANDDCLGIGPSEKFYLGRAAGYTRHSMMEYLRGKSHLDPR